MWGPEAESEASKRLAWVGLAQESRPLVDEIVGLRDVLADRGMTHVVLCGMGGSSLAPEVICATHGVKLTVLDSSDPDFVRSALAEQLERTVVVVSSKSGGTVETDSQKRAFEQAFKDADLEPAAHIIVVTDPGSPLDEAADDAGYRVFHADPEVGGRYSALTAFGLVPSGLAGANIGRLLDEAAAIQPRLESDDADNPSLRLGALLGVANTQGVDKVVLATDGLRHPRFRRLGGAADRRVDRKERQGHPAGRRTLPRTRRTSTPALPTRYWSPSGPVLPPRLRRRPGGAQPSTRPWARSCCCGSTQRRWPAGSSASTRSTSPTSRAPSRRPATCSRRSGETPTPDFTEGPVEVYATEGLLSDESTVVDAVGTLLGQIDGERGYLAVMAYLDRAREAHLAHVREHLAGRTGRPTTFGWGPRFLHSTGQYHKGGPPTGVYLQITAEPVQDLDDPRATVHLRWLHQRPGDRGCLCPG